MSDESPGATIRRARQEAGMKQRELADRMGVHATTVGYWERNKFFPEQHWAALNKLLHISLTPPGTEPAPEPESEPSIPPQLLRELRDLVARGERSPEWLARVVEDLEAIERERREEGPSSPRRRAG